MKKYLLKWSDGRGKYLEWDEFQVSYLPFFSDENGYSDEHRFLVNRLSIGESVDFSVGISQYHEVERLS